jgi:hypothetical protein
MTNSKNQLRLLVCLWVFGVSSLPIFAQSGTANGSIRGVVQDPSGAPVVRAEVEAHNAQTGFERKAITGDQGISNCHCCPWAPTICK